eukprot:4655604-Amphidinium_carterae.1
MALGTQFTFQAFERQRLALRNLQQLWQRQRGQLTNLCVAKHSKTHIRLLPPCGPALDLRAYHAVNPK